jgi:hypothetical protein
MLLGAALWLPVVLPTNHLRHHVAGSCGSQCVSLLILLSVLPAFSVPPY